MKTKSCPNRPSSSADIAKSCPVTDRLRERVEADDLLQTGSQRGEDLGALRPESAETTPTYGSPPTCAAADASARMT